MDWDSSSDVGSMEALMSELTVSVSVWLPVGRANFYSSTANNWLMRPGGDAETVSASSKMLEDPTYRPRLQVSVLRRVLEVLPVSFGYDRTGTCALNHDDDDDLQRPVAVSMTLHPKPDLAGWPECPEKTANLPLVAAGVHEVTFRVDEHGSYTFTARARFDADTDVRAALAAHVLEVFGGDYSLDRRSDHAARSGPAGENEGGAAVRRYQGLDTGSAAAEEKPRGILTFFQLNTLVEGLFNESLSPAVFFEQNDFLRDFVGAALPGSLTLVERMSQVIDLLLVRDVNAESPAGLVITLRRFLDVTAREVLQKLKWSVESVRRSLLDESVGMLHRQSKLVQLDLSALLKERTPELAIGASESQLRGYVMLSAAKLPVVANVHEIAMLAKDHLHNEATKGHGHGHVPVQAAAGGAARTLQEDVRRLDVELRHWKTLLEALRGNVRGLENAIEHAWRENLLYEQQQVRSEQEAMAEIERSRAGRPAERANMTAYNVLMLLFTVAAVLVAIREGNIFDPGSVSTDWQTWIRALSPIAAVTVFFALIVPVWTRWRQRAKDRRGDSEIYPYEFAFRLQEAADPGKVYAYLAESGPRPVQSDALRSLTLTSRGGGRIERVSPDRALVKIHSIATFKVGKRSYARFEIVKEILAHRVSGKPTYVIIQCRMFGDSPRALQPAEVIGLARAILEDVGVSLTGRDPQRGDEEGIEVEKVLALISPLYTGATAVATRANAAAPAPTNLPAQRT